MPVKITDFDTYAYTHDDAPGGSHGGTLDPATVTYGTDPMTGEPNPNIVVVPCPFEGCGSASYWPPGGGADALLGQSLHVIMAYAQPAIAAGRGATVADAADEVKARVVATDGEERWVLDEAALEVLRTRANSQ